MNDRPPVFKKFSGCSTRSLFSWIVGIAITAFDYRTGIVSGLLASLSPLLALAGAVPLADAPTSWLVLGAVWLLLIARPKTKASSRIVGWTPRWFVVLVASECVVVTGVLDRSFVALEGLAGRSRLLLSGGVVIGMAAACNCRC